MKRTLLACILAAFSAAFGTAQITVTNATCPAPGDTLRTATDAMPSGIELGPAGGPYEWDFSSLLAPFATEQIYYPSSMGNYANEFPGAEIYLELPGNSEGYFDNTGTKFQFLGSYGPDPIGIGIELVARFNPPLVERHAPLSFIDNFVTQGKLDLPFSADIIPAAILDNLPFTPDSLKISVTADRNDLVDAYGTLTIPGGAFEVLRMKRTEVRKTKLEAKIFVWVDVTQLIPGNETFSEVTTTSYHFFSNEAKEPIAVVTLNADGQTVQRVDFKSISSVINQTVDLGAVQPILFAYPNPAIEEVRFDFNGLLPGNYDLKIYNILGQLVWERNFWLAGNRTEKVNLARLRKGTYLYSLVDSNGKTLATKRLMIVRP